VADQVRPSDPIRCDGCNSVWQPGRLFWTRESQPLYRWCDRCRRRNEDEAQDWQMLTEEDIRAIAESDDGEAEPATAPAGNFSRQFHAAANRLLEGEPEIRPRIPKPKPQPKREEQTMPTGKYERTPEMNAKRLETRRRNAALRAAGAAPAPTRGATEPTLDDVLAAVAVLKRLSVSARESLLSLID
jgi:hypothetical protein